MKHISVILSLMVSCSSFAYPSECRDSYGVIEHKLVSMVEDMYMQYPISLSYRADNSFTKYNIIYEEFKKKWKSLSNDIVKELPYEGNSILVLFDIYSGAAENFNLKTSINHSDVHEIDKCFKMGFVPLRYEIYKYNNIYLCDYCDQKLNDPIYYIDSMTK